MKILVTGGAGYIGSHTCIELINAGYDSGRLEIELQHQGLEHGASIRNIKYKILEKRKEYLQELKE